MIKNFQSYLYCLFQDCVELLKGHKLSWVYSSYDSVVNLYCINYVLKNYGPVQINPTVPVSWYSHGKHIIDLHQFADVFVSSSFKSEINDERHPVFKPTMLESCVTG